jgi:hypothetical protein
MNTTNKTLKTDSKRKGSSKPGAFQPGNKFGKGRPKTGESIAEFTRAFLEETDPEKKQIRRTLVIQRAYDNVFDDERNDSEKWAEFLFNRAYGKPQESIDLKANVELNYTVSPRKKDEDE